MLKLLSAETMLYPLSVACYHPQQQLDGVSPGSCDLKQLVISNTVAFMLACCHRGAHTQHLMANMICDHDLAS